MPKILERLVSQLEAKGHTSSEAHAIAVHTLQRAGDLVKGTVKATAKGEARGKMTPGERAKDRAAKYSGNKKSEYKYNSKTNRATKK